MEKMSTERHVGKRRKPIKKEIVKAFACALLTTLFMTIALYTVVYFIFIGTMASGILYPANYSENHVEDVRSWVEDNDRVVFDPDAQQELTDLASSYHMSTMVVDVAGTPIAGIVDGADPLDRNILIEKLNTTENDSGIYRTYIPVLDDSGFLTGAVIVGYRLEASTAGNNDWVLVAVAFVLAALPAILLIASLLFFSNRLWKKFSEPLVLLDSATEKIKNRDLDFTIDYHEDDEIGDVLKSFNDMRSELKDSLEEQWRIERASTEMIQSLAHDIKTPIAVIYAYSESLAGLLKDGGRTEREISYNDVVLENARKSATLVRRLNETSVPITTWIGEDEPVAVMRILKETSCYYSRIGLDRDLNIQLDVTEDTAPTLTRVVIEGMDADSFRRIIENLISNAITYSPDSGTIEVSVDLKNGDLLVSVYDQGPGIPEGAQKKIFERSYRDDTARNDKNEHYGLGLYIVRSFVERAGGTVVAQNGKRGGACFRIVLPVRLA